MGLAKYKIEVPTVGGHGGSVIVNDKDVSSHVVALTVEAAVNEVSRLVLYTYAEGVIQGDGIVEIRPKPGDHKAAMIQWLSETDANSLDQQALNMSGWGTEGTLTSHILEILIGRLRETTP